MSLRALSRLLSDEAVITRSVTPAWRECFVALARQLAARIDRQANALKPPFTLRAYLLFECWGDNALAAEFGRRHPDLAAQRRSVPDDFYRGREDEAPCLVPLPAEARPPAESASLTDAFAQDWWAAWLEQIWLQTQQRLARQDFCAVLLTPAHAPELARHLARLGRQMPPGATQRRLLRYQDPRVMQRVWPALSPWQRSLWLGPVLAWCAPLHPWGPWASKLIGEDALPDEPPPQWFEAEAPATKDIDANMRIHRGALFDARQWTLAHSVPMGNRVWRRCAVDGMDATEQPGAQAMNHLTAEGQALGLSEQNLEDFIWYGWLGRWVEPETGQLRSAWQSPQGAHDLRRALDTLAQQPQARLAALLHEAGALPRRQIESASIPVKENPPGISHGR
jgi:hypothetical protein